MTAKANLPARVAEIPLTPRPPTLVLFGRGAGGKPCAAWFEAADAEAATAAAKAMQLRALAIETDEQRALVAQLPRGRVTPDGRARVPFAKHDPYARLVAIAGEEAGLRVAAGGQAAPAADPDRSDGAANDRCRMTPTASRVRQTPFSTPIINRACPE